jgi:hypothetical protein
MTATGFGALVYPLLSQLDGALAATLGMLFTRSGLSATSRAAADVHDRPTARVRVDRALGALLYTALLVDVLVAAPPSETLWWLANSALLLVPAAPPRGVSGATGGAAGIARAARRRRRRGAPPARSVTIGYDGLSTAAMLVGSLSGTAIRGAGENARLR